MVNSVLKGTVSRDGQFFEGSENENSMFCMNAEGFRIFWLTFDAQETEYARFCTNLGFGEVITLAFDFI